MTCSCFISPPALKMKPTTSSVFSTCGEGLDLQPDGSWYLWLGLRLFHVFLPKENSPESRKVILPALEYDRRCRRWWFRTNTRGADGSFSLSFSFFTATSCSMFTDLVIWECCSVPGWVMNFMMDLIVLAVSAMGMTQPGGREERRGRKEWPYLPHQESVEDLKTKIPAVLNSLLLSSSPPHVLVIRIRLRSFFCVFITEVKVRTLTSLSWKQQTRLTRPREFPLLFWQPDPNVTFSLPGPPLHLNGRYSASIATLKAWRRLEKDSGEGSAASDGRRRSRLRRKFMLFLMCCLYSLRVYLAAVVAQRAWCKRVYCIIYKVD